MNIKQYLDATYLKTAEQANVSKEENTKIVIKTIQEAIDNNFKLIMIRPEYVSLAKEMITSAKSDVTIGTVIDFPTGIGTTQQKLEEAEIAIANKVDDLDFVVDYQSFIKGKIALVKEQVITCTQLGLQNGKIVKWIIEVAALTNDQIIQLSALIKNVVVANFSEKQYEFVFVKSSTGFYKTQNNKPNGATVETIKLMLENASPLPVKAAGGVRTYDEAVAMIKLGVKRIGTSAAKVIADGGTTQSAY